MTSANSNTNSNTHSITSPSTSFFKNYVPSVIGGGCSAIVTKSAVAPLERIKLLKQSQSYYSSQNYNGLFQSIRYIWKGEGFYGFYRGNYSNIIRITPAYLLKFPLNEFYKKKIGNSTPIQLLASGVAAGLTQVCLTYPLDVMRTRMSLDHHMTTNYNKYFSCIKNIYHVEGISGFYKGFPVSALSYPMYVGIQFSMYETLCQNDFSYFSAPIAGMIAQSLMYPGDTIKRQLQINGLDNTKSKFQNPIHCIIQMYKTLGLRGFYAGFGINLLKAIPEVSIQFGVYELIKGLF